MKWSKPSVVNCEIHTEYIDCLWVCRVHNIAVYLGYCTLFSVANRCIFCAVDAEETEKVKSLKDTMLSFCNIQRDMQQTEAAAKYVMTQVYINMN